MTNTDSTPSTLVLRSTADLPTEMQFDNSAAAHVARTSGLTVSCRHLDPHCSRCIRAAARRVVAAEPTSTLTGSPA